MKLKEIFLTGLLCASPVFAQEVSEEELVAAAERMIAQEAEAQTQMETTATSEKSSPATEVQQAATEKKESEIPAFRGREAAKIVETGSWQRVILSAVLVLALGVGLFFGVQKYAKRGSQQNQKLKMEVVAQHHFSPKRSLVIVRVAGEHLLIGATDQSMNLIKSISLIDDEAGNLPQDFNNFLEDEFVQKRTLSI